MSPIEFALWMNGATGVLGEQPPSPEQWASIREKLGSVVGRIVADRLLDRADELNKRELAEIEAKQRHYEAMIQAKQAMAASFSNMSENAAFNTLSGVTTSPGLPNGTVIEVSGQTTTAIDRLKQALKMRNVG